MLVLLTAFAASEKRGQLDSLNQMMLSVKEVNGIHAIIPTSRIQVIEHILNGKLISFSGSKEILKDIGQVFAKDQPKWSKEDNLAAQWTKKGDYHPALRNRVPHGTDTCTTRGRDKGIKHPHYPTKNDNTPQGPPPQARDSTYTSTPPGTTTIVEETKKHVDLKKGTYTYTRTKTTTIRNSMDEDEIVTVYVTEVQTPDYVIILPTYSQDKFENFVEQFINDDVIITAN